MVEPTASSALPMSEAFKPASEESFSAESFSAVSFLGTLQDLGRLAKPRLSSLVLFTTAGGLFLAPGHISLGLALLTIAMTILAVASANTLNCYIERDSDRLMKRTRTRPLPQGRLHPRLALVAGLVEGAIAIPVLAFWVNGVTALLAAAAMVSYVAMYTPMKKRSAMALVVGAIPGAIPPLLGWTAVTGHFGAGGLALFAVMFFWQLPHFLAIALYLHDDYARAGILVMPLTQGIRATHIWIVLTTAMLVPSTLLLTPLHVAGRAYFAVALISGIGLFLWTLNGLELPKEVSSAQWGRRLFLGTIAYLTLLFVALGLNAA